MANRSKPLKTAVKGVSLAHRLAHGFDETLPAGYPEWPVVTYRDRIDFTGSYQKQAPVANRSDVELMFNYALAQVQLSDV